MLTQHKENDDGAAGIGYYYNVIGDSLGVEDCHWPTSPAIR